MQSERAFHQSIILKDKLYLVGGRRNDKTSADTCETLDTHQSFSLNNSDSDVGFDFPPMLEKRCSFGMCSFGECVIVAGGEGDSDALKACEIFTPQAGKWLKIADMNTKRCYFTLTYFQQKVWAIGGFDTVDCKFFGKGFDTIETYNLAEDKWSVIDVKLLKKRMGHSTVAYNDKLFVIGGYNENEGTLSSVEVYSSVTNQFSFVSAMKIPRLFFGCCLVNSRIYVTGGMSDFEIESSIDEVEIYDINYDIWMSGPKLPLAITAHSCTSNVSSE